MIDVQTSLTFERQARRRKPNDPELLTSIITPSLDHNPPKKLISELIQAERRRSEIVCDIDATLGEWSVRHDELDFGKKIVDGGTCGHDVFAGRWHGRVVIHDFKLNEDDDVNVYLVSFFYFLLTILRGSPEPISGCRS